jgi:hypothetical protein
VLDRLHHLSLFLAGEGDTEEDMAVVLSDEQVKKQINQQPLDAESLFKAVRRVSHFTFGSYQIDEFLFLFGRYR